MSGICKTGINKKKKMPKGLSCAVKTCWVRFTNKGNPPDCATSLELTGPNSDLMQTIPVYDNQNEGIFPVTVHARGTRSFANTEQ